MVEYLNKLLANFVVMQYKVHSIHTDVVGTLFLDVHLLLNDVYKFFGDDNVDLIKERVRVLKDFTSSNLCDLIDLAEIEEISKVPSMVRSLEVVFADLETIEKCLNEGKDLCTENKDLDTQQILIDFSLAVGTLRWKVESVLAKATLA